MEELYRRGVRNFVVEGDGATGGGETAGMTAATVVGGGMTDANIILVRDSLQALQQLAAYHRRQFALPVIGITGSNGKTIAARNADHRKGKMPAMISSQLLQSLQGVPDQNKIRDRHPSAHHQNG